jgi:hypothetical protein
MPLSLYALRLLGLAETLHRWLSVLTGLDRANRERIADYADAIAATLGRAAAAIAKLDAAPDDALARTDALRELGRITGYVETIVAVLEQHLDGRKIAGVKRRLDRLDADRLAALICAPLSNGAKLPERKGHVRADRLLAAEGYLRALADGLRA